MRATKRTAKIDIRGGELRDAVIKNLIVFGSLSVSLAARSEGIAPRLPFHESAAILEDGEPNLLSALRWEYGLASTQRGRDADLAAILAWAEGGGNTVQARLITGPGGAGKTRLAAARESAKSGATRRDLRQGEARSRVRLPRAGAAPRQRSATMDYPRSQMRLHRPLLRPQRAPP